MKTQQQLNSIGFKFIVYTKIYLLSVIIIITSRRKKFGLQLVIGRNIHFLTLHEINRFPTVVKTSILNSPLKSLKKEFAINPLHATSAYGLCYPLHVMAVHCKAT
jgi:hypothetical protein